VARGVSNKIIAKDLRISEATVKTHLLHIFAKLGVDDRTVAVTAAMERRDQAIEVADASGRIGSSASWAGAGWPRSGSRSISGTPALCAG
jgi:Bacterial regulatory proteins, luxR family